MTLLKKLLTGCSQHSNSMLYCLYTQKSSHPKKRIGIQSHVYSGVAIPVELMVISTPGGGRVENRLLIEIAHRATPVEK